MSATRGFHFLVLFLVGASLGADRVIEIDSGKLKGSTAATWTGRTYWAFKGIRYAKPPVGNLRFHPPSTDVKWLGVKNARVDPPACIQAINLFVNQSEDCLFLNVYTPKIETSQPVIVYFHHGSYMRGSGRSDFLSPDYLMDQDIVLVVPNFRLGAFGFLTTGDRHATGNYGLKDQTAVLNWVKQNVNRFGGNPDMVTIAGYDTGSTSVLLHMMSPLSKGLFRKAIAMSGPVIGKWVMRTNGPKLAKRLAALNNCTTTRNDNMITCLKSVPARQLHEATEQMQNYILNSLYLFTPVVESANVTGKQKFLVEEPSTILQTHQLDPMRVVLGITKDEYFGIQELNDKYDVLLNQLSVLENTKHKSYKLKEIYILNETVKAESYGTGKVFSDMMIILPQIRTARALVANNCPTYFYMTSFAGSATFLPHRRPTDVGHFDNLLYLFHLPQNLQFRWKPTDREAHAVKAFTSMWGNFANTGDPTPTGMIGAWGPWIRKAPSFLDINEKISMVPFMPHVQRMVKLQEYMELP